MLQFTELCSPAQYQSMGMEYLVDQSWHCF